MPKNLSLFDKVKFGFRQKKTLTFVAMIGLAIRLVLAPFTGHPFDIYVWYQASLSILKGNLIPSGGFTMMPAWYYTIVPISYAYHWLSPILSAHPTAFDSLPPTLQSAANWTIPQGAHVLLVTDWLYNLLIKIPGIISDLIAGFVIYRITLPSYGLRAATLSFALWLLNPMLIWVSSVWGMYDSLPALFSLLAIYFLLEQKYMLSSIMEIIAISYKLYAVFLIPVLLIYYYRSGLPVKKLFAPIALSSVLGVVFFFPLITHGVQNYFSTQAQSGATPQAFGLTYWSIEPFLQISPSALNTLNILVYTGLLSLFLALSLFMVKKGKEDSVFVFGLALTSVIFFSYPTVSEQWYVWLLPTLIILSIKKLTTFRFVIALSIVSLVYSWINSQFVAFFLSSYTYGTTPALEYWTKEIALTSFIRLTLMAILGIGFSAILGIAIFKAIRSIWFDTHTTKTPNFLQSPKEL